jgi:hypothetical protein
METNPYQPPASVETEVVEQATPGPVGRPARRENRFVDALVAGWWLVRCNALRVLAVVLLVWLPINAFVTYQQLFVLQPDDIGGGNRLGMLLQWLLGVIGTGTVVALGVGCWQQGRPIGLGRAFSASFSQWGKFVASTFLGGILLLVGLLLIVLPGLFVALCFGWVYPVYVIERPGVWAGLRRSADITLRHFWLSLALFVATTIIALAGTIATWAAAYAVSLAELPPMVQLPIYSLLGLPMDYVAACTWLLPTAALLRIQEDEGQDAAAELDPAQALG